MRILVPDADTGARLDKLLVQNVPGLDRAGAKRLFADRKVRLVPAGSPASHGRTAKGSDVARGGDALELEFEESVLGAGAVPDPDAPLRVLLVTPQVVVLDKPAGQHTAPLAPGERGTLANALVARYPETATAGYVPREPGLCYRLDTGTSGIILAARTPEAFAALTRALKEARLVMGYLAICAAADLPESGTIDIPLARHPRDRRRVYACVDPCDVARLGPRPASTSFQKLRERGGWVLVEVKAPRSARHQIRAHFAVIGHPLVGDALYGGPPLGREGHTGAEGARNALHAHHLAWKGDATVPAFVVDSPLPPDLAGLIEE